MKFDIKDKTLASVGKKKIEWAGESMQVLSLIKDRFEKEKPLRDINIGACLHVTAETANLMLALQAGGANLALCACNPLSTQDDVASSLVFDYEIPTFAIKGEDNKVYYQHINAVLDTHPQITMDDGGDLISLLHTKRKEQIKEVIGSNEETTTGIIRLKAMEKEKALKIPVMAINYSDTKHMFDNRYGTGQSTIDGIMRATNILLAGKTFVVCGYGWCGRGLASRARGMGAHVVVTEVDPVKALEAVMDGYEVMKIGDAAKIGNIFVTVTGDKHVISIDHILQMRDGAILANAGHFNVEIAIEKLEKISVKKRQLRPFVEEYSIKVQKSTMKKIYVLGEGRLINLVAAEGHPAEVMDMSFANQALACEWLVKHRGKLSPKVYRLPQKIDTDIARLKLEALGVKIDKLTKEQENYLNNWQEGT
ncbi:adenosylhomocysteinase [Candidatus Gottesmanbacteria bacterium]|nr:adenosylhomocysteinase [Candidatus Gottesmanbacteria bacterium]